MNKAIASCLGIGFIKGGGTVAALACCIVIYFIPKSSYAGYSLWFFAATLAVCILGVWVSNTVEAHWGKDSSRVVIDEVAGMMVSIVFLPHTWQLLAAGLVLFRFFDIIKPLGIRRMEKLTSGLGVMMDDILAGVYSNILLQMAVIIFKF